MAAKAGRLQIQVEAQITKLQQDLDRANRIIENSATNWKKSFQTVFAGNLANDFVQKLGAAISQTIQDLGDIADKSQALGDTAEMFQRLAYAADQSGVSMDSVVSASAKLQKQLGEGSKETEAALKALGLSLEQVRKLSTGEAFITVAGRLGEVASASTQAALAADTMGKGFQAIKPLAAQGEQALRAMTGQAAVASDAAVKAADEFGDSVAAMQGSVKVFIAEALAPLLPLLTKSAQEFTNVGNNASGAASGIDRSTSSARQLGETLAGMLQGLGAFRDLLNNLQAASVQAVKGDFRWPWEDEEKDPVDHIEEIRKAWSRMTTTFFDVEGAVASTEKLVDHTRDAANASDEAAKAAEREAAARKNAAEQRRAEAEARRLENEAKKAQLELDRRLDEIVSRSDAQANRETDLINERTLAIMRLNGATENQIELERMRLNGASANEIATVEEIQQIEDMIEAQRQATQEAEALSNTIADGFANIFMAMTEGSEQAKKAIADLLIQLAAMYLQMLALNALKQMNAGGTWGFQGVAKGGVFDQHGMMPFAQGGIVRRATAFRFGGGQLGVMGEAGPEAILPLGRDAMGRLGVRGGGVNVNVHNYAGADVSVESRGNDVAIIVDQVRGVIANDISRGGSLIAGSLEGAYRLRR